MVLMILLLLTVLVGGAVFTGPRLGGMMALCFIFFILVLMGDGKMALSCTARLHMKAHEAYRLKPTGSRHAWMAESAVTNAQRG
jgi:hypothetical protein